MSDGFITIGRREFREDRFWTEKRTFSLWEAWVDMIQLASWQERQQLVGMTLVTLARGELLASVRFLARRWGWSKNRVHRYLALCVEDGRISGQQRTSEGDTYLVVNYDDYQGVRDSGGTAPGTAAGQQRDSSGTRKKKLEEVQRREEGGVASAPPPGLNSEESRAAAAELVAYRRSMKLKPIRDWQRFWSELGKKLVAAGYPADGAHAAEAIRYSMGNSYQGVFPPKRQLTIVGRTSTVAATSSDERKEALRNVGITVDV